MSNLQTTLLASTLALAATAFASVSSSPAPVPAPLTSGAERTAIADDPGRIAITDEGFLASLEQILIRKATLATQPRTWTPEELLAVEDGGGGPIPCAAGRLGKVEGLGGQGMGATPEEAWNNAVDKMWEVLAAMQGLWCEYCPVPFECTLSIEPQDWAGFEILDVQLSDDGTTWYITLGFSGPFAALCSVCPL